MDGKPIKEIGVGYNKNDTFLILPNGEKVQMLREFRDKYAVCKMNEDKYATKDWWLINK